MKHQTQTLWEELADLIGPHFARVLTASFGGQNSYISTPVACGELRTARILAELLGADLAARMRHGFPGMRVYLPSAAQAEMKERDASRDRAIVAMKEAGASNRDIIRAHGIAIRRIQEIVARERA